MSESYKEAYLKRKYIEQQEELKKKNNIGYGFPMFEFVVIFIIFCSFNFLQLSFLYCILISLMTLVFLNCFYIRYNNKFKNRDFWMYSVVLFLIFMLIFLFIIFINGMSFCSICETSYGLEAIYDGFTLLLFLGVIYGFPILLFVYVCLFIFRLLIKILHKYVIK